MPPRRDAQLLVDIVDRADLTTRLIGAASFDEWSIDERSVESVVRQLEVIGEAARAVSDDLKQRHPEIPWQNMVSTRNFVMHQYRRVRTDVVWDTATQSVPSMRSLVWAVLEAEFPLEAKALEEHRRGAERD